MILSVFFAIGRTELVGPGKRVKQKSQEEKAPKSRETKGFWRNLKNTFTAEMRQRFDDKYNHALILNTYKMTMCIM